MEDNTIIYQLALRSFTPEGTLKAAEKLLPHIASLNADIVYLCPVFKAENDEDRTTWSPRQIASGTDNPKNPYKMADYFNVDEEYGSNDDLKDFVNEAHKNGLKVLFDLVYLHCGRGAVFIKDNPDFVERNVDGTTALGETWPFARLNFNNPELRRYLIKNMEVLINEYKADGFRCDVGDGIPLDFWRESFEILKKIKPDLITLNEGSNKTYIKDAFDMGYAFEWRSKLTDAFIGKIPASDFKKYCLDESEKYGDDTKKLIRTIETHDTASDCGISRNEITMTARGVEAALAVTNTYVGVPFIWNGYEVCDNAENCMFSNRYYGRRSSINWSRGFTDDGIKRMKFVRDIHSLHHEYKSLSRGRLLWVDNSEPEQVISYMREYEDEKIMVIVNAKNQGVNFDADVNICKQNILLGAGVEIDDRHISMEAYGYMIVKL